MPKQILRVMTVFDCDLLNYYTV